MSIPASNPAYRMWLFVLLVSFAPFPVYAQADDVEAGVEEENVDQPPPEAEDAKPAEPVEPKKQGELAGSDLLKEQPKKQGAQEQLDDLPDFGSALIRMVIVLVAMIVLMLVLSKLLPRWLSKRVPSMGKRMRVVDRMQVEPGRSLLVVHIGGQYLLMASDSEGLRPVATEAIDQEALRAAFDADLDETAKKSSAFSTLLNASRSVGGDPSASGTSGKEASV